MQKFRPRSKSTKVSWPHRWSAQLLPEHHFAGSREQQGQDARGLRRELDDCSLAPQFVDPEVEREGSEPAAAVARHEVVSVCHRGTGPVIGGQAL